MIELKNLSKVYHAANKEIVALDGINLTIHDGEIFGIIGLSGAPVNILFADTRIFEGVLHGHMVIELPNDAREAEKIITWLKGSGVNWKEEI